MLAAGAAQAKVEGDTIILGSAISLTGKYATNGVHAQNGYEIAVKKINDGEYGLCEDCEETLASVLLKRGQLKQIHGSASGALPGFFSDLQPRISTPPFPRDGSGRHSRRASASPRS